MKKLLQSVALVFAVLLAVQPAMATMTCTQNICGTNPTSVDCCTPANDASMQGMSSDTSMQPMLASLQASTQSMQAILSRNPEPCCTLSSLTAPKLVPSTKFTASRTIVLRPLGGLSPVTAPVLAAQATGDVAAPAPARYILFQAFRI
jgi:hypothetical protein